MQSMIFMNYEPEYNCTDNRLLGNKNASVRWVSDFPKFDLVDRNQSEVIEHQAEISKHCSITVESQNELTNLECGNWTFDTSVMLRTVVSQFGLVCSRHSWIPWLESSYLFANSFGFVIASFGDTLGRKKTFLAFVSLEIVVCLITPFVGTVGWLLVMRVLRGLSTCLMYLGINLISEFVPVHLRSAYGNNFWMLFGVGYMSCAGIAYLTRDWIQLRLWMCLFLLFYLPCPFILSESPRWLCLRGYPEEASRVLKRVAYWNAAHLPDTYFEKVDIFLTNESNKLKHVPSQPSIWEQITNVRARISEDSICALLTHPNLRLRCIVLCFVHTSIAFVYLGVITDSSFATKNIFLNVFLMGLMELFSGFVAWGLCEYLGRRTLTSILLTLTAICVGCTELDILTHPAVRMVMAVAGKFFLSVAYCVSDLYILESFPTSIRTSSFFLVVTVAGLFGALAPFINNLRRIAKLLPTVAYCSTAVAGAALALAFLPETRHCPLAQTVNESEQLVRGKERQWVEFMKLSKPEAFIPHQTIEVTKDKELNGIGVV